MNKRTLKVIKDIHASVPQELTDKLFEEVYIAPELRLKAIEALQELRKEADALPVGVEKEAALKSAQRLQNIIDAGYYDEKERRVVPEVAAEIERYIEKELDRAITEGRIPHPKDDRSYQSFLKKIRKHERKNQKSAERRARGGEGDPEGSSPTH